MQNSIFSQIRKKQSTLQLFVAVMANLMVFSQPLHYALYSNNKQYFPSNSSSYSFDFVNQNEESSFNNALKTKQPLTTTTIVTKSKATVAASTLNEEVDANSISATEKQGIIGKSENLPIDELTDNIFSFELKNEVKNDKDLYLEYELFGLADGSQAIKSINDQLATGGSIIKTTKEWVKVKEKLNPSDIQKGKNNIKFTTWEQSKFQYMVRNLRLVYEDKTKETAITFHQSEAKSYQGSIAVSGFITDLSIKKVTILEKEYPVINGVFEALVEEKAPNASLVVSYVNDKGNTISNAINVTQLLDKPTELHKEIKSVTSINKQFSKGVRSSLAFGGAKLEVDSLSLEENQNISIAGLRYVDIPTLSPEMVNVTADYFGYRMLPHGNLFSKNPAKLYLKFDQSKLPSGYTAKDIKTFYFDTDQKKWKALEKDTILTNTNEIVSKTNHFTDFINGIIKVPESPETGSFTPTSIKDIKAAEPTTGVVSIAPPSPNNMGTVNTSFPIKLPAGRSEMQPSLSVNYNSEGGNGWMGLGWDLSIPGVSLDTRWGAPRYDTAKETEIYSMGGGMLTLDAANPNGGTALPDYTNPHRRDNILRNTTTNQRQFYPRIEGSYSQIIRHGDNPTNYWWEVTDKMGNKSFYGGHNGAIDNTTVIRTGNLTTGNIAYWALSRTEDTNGNYVEYIYENNYGISLGGQPGEGGNEFYIKEIKYTLHNTITQNNYYKVEFIKDGDPGYAYVNRNDKQINARNGVVQVTKNVLKEIKIGLFQNSTLIPIRSYRFDYNQHAFFKQQLVRIAEHDANGDLFYSNTMEYVDKGEDGTTVIDNDNFINGAVSDVWNGSGDDGIDGNLISGNAISNISGEFSNKGSILGTSESGGFNGGLYIGFGVCCGVTISLTAGINGGYSASNGNGLISFMDINGDGLPDKVYRDGGVLKFKANLGSLGTNTGFSNIALPVSGINSISRTSSDSKSVGAQASFGAFVGYTYNKSKSVTSTYFSDVNGDGLVDLVDDGSVQFNQTLPLTYLNQASFTPTNSTTPNPIGSGLLSEGIVDSVVLETENELRDESPQHDIVKVWIAPKNGTVNIYGTAKIDPLTPFPLATDEYFNDYDGIRLSIQHNGSIITDGSPSGPIIQPSFSNSGSVIENQTVVNMGYSNLSVVKGDRVYFRVQANEEGSYDRVRWIPDVIYTGANNTDANALSYYSCSARDGFIMSADAATIIPQDGQITINWNNLLNTIPALHFSDDLIFQIEKGTIDATSGVYSPVQTYTQTYNQITGGSIVNTSFDGQNFTNVTVLANEVFKFRVISDSNVNWKLIDWKPVITLDPTAAGALNQDLYAMVDYQFYNQKIQTVESKVQLPNIIDIVKII
jgi:Salmonella virulence plasmid 65kDa B protein